MNQTENYRFLVEEKISKLMKSLPMRRQHLRLKTRERQLLTSRFTSSRKKEQHIM